MKAGISLGMMLAVICFGPMVVLLIALGAIIKARKAQEHTGRSKGTGAAHQNV